MSSNEAETIYERVAKLEDEVASLRNELDILKGALKNKLARHQIKMIKKGDDVSSLFDYIFSLTFLINSKIKSASSASGSNSRYLFSKGKASS